MHWQVQGARDVAATRIQAARRGAKARARGELAARRASAPVNTPAAIYQKEHSCHIMKHYPIMSIRKVSLLCSAVYYYAERPYCVVLL